jgi:hypothetical protein
LNPEIVELFPGSKLCSQPAWLFPAARPSLRRLQGISILRKHLRVRAPRVRHLLNIGRWLIFFRPTPRQLVDVGTKAVPRTSIRDHDVSCS